MNPRGGPLGDAGEVDAKVLASVTVPVKGLIDGAHAVRFQFRMHHFRSYKLADK